MAFGRGAAGHCSRNLQDSFLRCFDGSDCASVEATADRCDIGLHDVVNHPLSQSLIGSVIKREGLCVSEFRASQNSCGIGVDLIVGDDKHGLGNKPVGRREPQSD